MHTSSPVDSKNYLFVLIMMLLPVCAGAQSNALLAPRTRTLFAYSDLYKTSFERPFRKLQAGVEVGYRLNEVLMITGGLEFWNQEPTPLVAVGNRFYPFGATFIRYRALVGRTADVALGIGHSTPLSKHLLLEASADYYLDEREIGFRLGVGYRWQEKQSAE